MRVIAFVFSFLLSHFALAESNWTHESELGIVLTGGNTSSQTVNLAQTTKYSFSMNVFSLTGGYLLGQSSDVLSARQWNLGLRYEREFTEMIGAFVGVKTEGDTFAGYDYRVSPEIGGKFYFLKAGKKDYIFNETGFRYTREQKIAGVTPDTQDSYFIRVYFEGAKSISESAFGKLWVEFLPDLNDTDNLQINFEPSLSVILNSVFSVKMAFLGRFDNQPAVATNDKFDYTYTTSLVASID